MRMIGTRKITKNGANTYITTAIFFVKRADGYQEMHHEGLYQENFICFTKLFPKTQKK